MKKLAALIFGGLFAGVLSGNTMHENSVDVESERETRKQEISSVSENTPVFLSLCQNGKGSTINWHSSHCSHSSHRSHYSHRSSY
jgi:hypothetical protein